MQNSYEISDSTLKFVGAAALSALAFFGVIYNRQAQTTPSPATLSQNDEAISRALEEYTEFFRKVGIDKDIIEAVLVEHDSAVTACGNLVATEREKLRQFSATVPGITHFQNTKRSITKSRSSRYSELFQEYKELFKTYPILGLQGWISGEEKWELTVEMVEQAQANCEEHHAKFLAVAEELLHESGLVAQRANNDIERKDASISNKLK